MLQKRIFACVPAILFVFGLLLAASQDAQAQDKKKGTVTGEIKSSKASPNGKNTIIDVLAPGEEKARSYRVQYDPAVKAPIAAVLTEVRAAKVGDTCKFDWVDTGEGLAITKFEIVRKASDKK